MIREVLYNPSSRILHKKSREVIAERFETLLFSLDTSGDLLMRRFGVK